MMYRMLPEQPNAHQAGHPLENTTLYEREQ